MAHRRWLANQKFEHAAQQIVFQEGIDAVEDAVQRLRRLEKQLALIVPEWSMAPVVEAYQAMRDASFLVAVTFAAEIRLRAPIRYAETADVLPRSCPGGTLDRRYNPMEWPHLSGQPASAASAHRGGLDITLSRESQRDLQNPAGSAAKARARHGWSERELFALPERWARIDQCGVAWLIGERRVIGVTADAIAIETEFGARLRFHRRADAVPLP